jgi:hypothetical protein
MLVCVWSFEIPKTQTQRRYVPWKFELNLSCYVSAYLDDDDTQQPCSAPSIMGNWYKRLAVYEGSLLRTRLSLTWSLRSELDMKQADAGGPLGWD